MDSNTALHAEVDRRVADLEASRRRLLLAADEEQARLERRIRDGAEHRLEGLSELLRSAGKGEHLARARDETARTLTDLRDLARGLRPRELEHGLRTALVALAERTPVPVDVRMADRRYDTELESTAWFVCAEAVANAVKHAGAGQTLVEVSPRDGHLVLAIADDGCGGADFGRGTGLRGLADRVEALGGRFRLDSPAGGGTRLTAELPLGRQPR